MWLKPICDRTKYDVDLIKLDPMNKNQKGAYNYTDLNRIECDCEYLMNLFNTNGMFSKKINLNIKKDWKVSDIPTIEDINRIRKNILILKNDMKLEDLKETIEFSNTMNYTKANILEKHLELIMKILNTYNKQFYRCNNLICGSIGFSSIYIKKEIKNCGDLFCGKENTL